MRHGVILIHLKTQPEGKFLATKFEFGASFGMSLEGDCHELEVTPNLELLVTFGVSWREFVIIFTHNFIQVHT
jgi:hypothetical protein